MITRAIARYVRISPRKTRKVIDLIRGLNAVKAGTLLSAVEKRPVGHIKKLLDAALDAADKRFQIPASELYISLIKADQGPMLKRYRAASMGRATMIKHKTSHITIELDKVKRYDKKSVREMKDVSVDNKSKVEPDKKEKVKPKTPKSQLKEQKTAVKTKKNK
ncbi:MAG: 50S ribosomal protein L22 [Candidatus Omnitrophica bacterium]|nr:50S ribosomal protein L22 [Candidatus Omnitrophota bacterium]